MEATRGARPPKAPSGFSPDVSAARAHSQRHVPVMLFVLAIALGGARVASHYLEPAPSKTTAVQWISLDALKDRRTDRPILFLFTAEWSAPARALDGEALSAPDIAGTINERFLPVRIVDRQREDGRNAPRVEELERHFSVSEFPTIVISDGSGNELARMEGSHDEEDLAQVLRRFR